MVLLRFLKVLDPGARKEERGWQPIKLELRGRLQGAETLELSYSSKVKRGMIALAGGYLRRME
jgi:hypothetical protein